MTGEDEDQQAIRLYAIYEHPIVYREGYVVREWQVTGEERQPGQSWRASSLEEARTHLPAGR
jgi:hypothetical protein